MKELKALPNLTRLALAGTKVTDASVSHLATLKKLTWLDLSYTGVTERGINTLKKAPRLRHPALKSKPSRGRARGLRFRVKSSMTRRRWWLIGAAITLVAAPASANGAMGMALATFEWPLWLTYVAVTVALEAVLFGVCLRISPLRALGLSIAANALTGLIGGYLSGIPSYGFQSAFGTSTNPNPFGRILLLFTLSALLSAWLEGKVWSAGARSLERPPSAGRVKAVSLAVHLITLPVGLAILLSPDRLTPD